MPTVSQAVQILEQVTDVPAATIKAVARQLIDDELLPKSAGRRIEQIQPRHMALLMFAIYASKTARDASRVALRYYNLHVANGRVPTGIPSLMMDYGSTAGNVIARIIMQNLETIAIPICEPKRLDNFTLEICTSFTEVRVNHVREIVYHSGAQQFPILLRFHREDDYDEDIYRRRPAVLAQIPEGTLQHIAELWLLLHPDLASLSGADRVEAVRKRYPEPKPEIAYPLSVPTPGEERTRKMFDKLHERIPLLVQPVPAPINDASPTPKLVAEVDEVKALPAGAPKAGKS